MNRSYSKKRHINQANALIESRFISERSIYGSVTDFFTNDESKWMAPDAPTRYWSVLYRRLNETFGYWKIGPKSAIDIPEATFFYSGKFVIYKGGDKNFVEYWEDNKLIYYGNIKSNDNSYAGEPIENTILTTNLPMEYRGPNGEETLFYFIKNLLGKGTSKSWNGIKGVAKGAAAAAKSIKSSSWDTTCDGESKPFKKMCKGKTIKKVQGCLGIKDDGLFGSGTATAVKNKIGKNFFTNADIDKLCDGTSTNIGGGGVQPPVTDTQKPAEEEIPTETQAQYRF